MMSLLRIAEVFGHDVNDNSKHAIEDRESRRCPFKGAPCNKVNLKDPVGVCSFTDGERLATVCPTRFIESGVIFKDAGRLAFGPGIQVIAAPEVRVLRVPGAKPGAKEKRIGKIDYLVAKLDANSTPIDFAALEVQAVYFSGEGIKPDFKKFIRTGSMPATARRRPDWRSSAQKRLMPQLSLKVPIFRRWGKKFFVAVDSLFFAELPSMQTTESFANSEITWLVYPFEHTGNRFAIGTARVVYTTWDDVLTALREGIAPDPAEVLHEIRKKIVSKGLRQALT